MSFYVKIYNRHHEELDEIHEIGDINYTPSLNNIGSFTFNIPLKCEKFTEKNFTEENHIELYEDNDKNCVWWGVISAITYDDPSCFIGCYGYLHLLKDRKLEDKTYTARPCGSLIMDILSDVNTIYPTGIEVGEIYGSGAITERILTKDDYCLDKILQYVEEYNYVIEVDKNRRLNFYSKIGEDKSYLKLIWNEEYSNIIKKPSINRQSNELANKIYAESTFVEEANTLEGNVKVDVVLKSIKEDKDSIEKYGLKEKFLKFDNIHLHETLEERCKAELDRISKPSINITLEVRDSDICPMNSVSVGDLITLELPHYHGFKDKIRVLEIHRDVQRNVYTLTVGTILLKNVAPKIKQYA